MSTLKTSPNRTSVESFLLAVDNDQRREDCRRVMTIMEAMTGHKPGMWGPSIIGYGSYHYVYASGREGDWFLTGLSPRKHDLTLYVMSGFSGLEDLLSRLGKHRTGKGCLYIKRLDDVDLEILQHVIQRSIERLRERYPSMD